MSKDDDRLTVPGMEATEVEETENERMGSMGYQETLMYGRYSRSLGDKIKEEAKRQKLVEKRRKKEYRKRKKELRGKGECYQRTAKIVTFIWRNTFARIGEDWVFLALLGMIMALVSFAMDYTISICNQARLWLVKDLMPNIVLQFLAWVSLPVFLVLFSTGFVHVVAPQAIGSGIPEMKTILRGVVLKEYLTFRTLLAKVVGLTATLGSGMPLGKEGPFVHIASIVATLLTKLVTSFQGIYANESRNSEMLAAACAVGVACCFGSPIGGVLFSIEVTSVYFAVRNYWRGFFSAVIGAIVFRLLSIWFEDEETIVAVFRTGFPMEFPYDPQELLVFTIIGVCCGLGGALYVYMHRRYVLWMRGNKKMTRFLQRNRFIYPFLVSGLISAVTFPPGPGMFQAADVTTHRQIETLFSNFTWARDVNEMTVDEYDHIKHWKDPFTQSIFVNLAVYIISTFFLSILAQTLPVPTGALIPSFKMGAAFGRLVGEAMHVWFPDGVRYGSQISYIMPGGYATVGAAAFSGAVTHTISISVIVFEMTGQITHCVPVLIAVLVANAIAACLQPSCYDSIILIKKLPYLPDIIPSSSGAYNIFVEDFMVRDIRFIWYGMTYKELRDILRESRKLRGFPLVDNPDQMVLLGSIQRTELISAIEKQIGKDRRLAEASVRWAEEMEKESEERRKNEEDSRIRKLQEELEREEEKKDKQDKKVNGGLKDAKEDESVSNRRPSRFAVSSVLDKSEVEDNQTVDLMTLSPSTSPTSPKTSPNKDTTELDNFQTPEPAKQIKGILKKQTDNSVTIHGFPRDTEFSPPSTPYQTVSGAQERWRNTVTSMQQMFSGIKTPSLFERGSLGWDFGEGGYSGKSKKVDMSLEEQREWEKQEMDKAVNFTDLHIDPAPFQLVEKSNLLKVHSLFSMLGVNHAYVTTIGRLIGVVGLKELRKAIEDANSGHVVKTSEDEESGKKFISLPKLRKTSMDSNSMMSEESEDILLKR